MNDTVYTINYQRTVQVSPDDWETYHISIEIDDSITFLEIKQLIANELKIPIDKVDLRGMKIGALHKINR